MTNTTNDEKFDYFGEIRRTHEALTFVPDHINQSQAKLFSALECVLDSKDAWYVKTDLDKAEKEIDKTIDLLEEIKDDIDDIRAEVPENDDP